MRIIIKGADLYSPSTDERPEGGVLYRAGRRIKARQQLGFDLNEREQRNLIVGELAEAAVAMDYRNRGFQVNEVSWEEFNNKHIMECGIDLFVHKGSLTQKIQVKGSEFGNRALRGHHMFDYEREKIDKIIFVAVRELKALDGELYFECELTSQLSPRQIRQSASWTKPVNDWIHVENAEFIKQWILESSRKGATQFLTPKYIWN